MSDYCELSNLTKIYPSPKGPAVIVKDFNLRIRKGEFVTLIGHSGCGKSTVLSMLAGLSDITGGGIILAGKELDGDRKSTRLNSSHERRSRMPSSA